MGKRVSKRHTMKYRFLVFQSDKVDYDSVNALRYLSAYMISLENSGTDVDSIKKKRNICGSEEKTKLFFSG